MKYRMLIKMDSEAFAAASLLCWVDLIVCHQNIWHPEASFIQNRQWELCPSLSYFIVFCIHNSSTLCIAYSFWPSLTDIVQWVLMFSSLYTSYCPFQTFLQLVLSNLPFVRLFVYLFLQKVNPQSHNYYS